MRPLLSLALLLFLCTCARAQLTLTTNVGLAEGYCMNPDPDDCDPVPEGMEFLTYLPGQDDDIVVTYRVINNTAGVKITKLGIRDDRFGEVVAFSDILVGPGETYTITRRYPGFTNPETLEIPVEALVEDDRGNQASRESTYKIDVVSPRGTVSAELYRAREVCANPTDLGTCGASGGSSTITVAAGDSLLLRFPTTNTGLNTLTNHVWTDNVFGPIASTAFDLEPGQTIIAQSLQRAPFTPGTYNYQLTWTAEDPAGNALTRRANYTVIVQGPSGTLSVELYRARDVCADPTDLGTCGASDGPATITVAAGDSLLIRYPVTNTGPGFLTNHVWTDSRYGVVANTSFNLDPGSTIIGQTLEKAPDVPGTYLLSATWTAEDEGGNVLTETFLYSIIVEGPSGTLSVELYRARDVCADPTDLGTCGASDGPSTITVAAGDSLLIRYPVTNTGPGFLTNHVWTDSRYGVVANTSFNLDPGSTIIGQTLEKAPDAPGTYNITATWTSEDEGGNVLTETFIYTIIVEGPSGTLSVELYRARDVCADPTSIATCGASDGPSTITVAAGDSLLIRYPVTNTGPGFLTNHAWTDSRYGVVANTSFNLDPGTTIIGQTLEKAPDAPGTYNITATWTSEDEGGNVLTVTFGYTVIVVEPSSTLDVETYLASDICTDPTSLATCGTGTGGGDQITTGAGENIYVEYPVSNTGLGPLTNHAWTTDLFGEVTTTSFVLQPGQSITARAIHTAPADPGTYDVTATYTAEDEGGNLVTETVVFTVKVICSQGDFAPPVARCRNRTFTILEDETLSLNAGMFDDGSSDGCGSIAGGFLDVTSLDCDDAGATVVTLTVEDESRNQASCTATVTLNVLDGIFRGERNNCVSTTTELAVGQAVNEIRTPQGQLIAELIIGNNTNLFEAVTSVYRTGSPTEGSGALEHLSKRISITFFDEDGNEVQPNREPVYVRLFYLEEELAALGGDPNTYSIIKTTDDDCGSGYSAQNAEAMALTEVGFRGCQQTDRFYEFFTGGFSTFYLFRTDLSLPVEFLAFTARLAPKKRVLLDWQTASESGNSHFSIERSGDGDSFVALGEVAGAGTTSEEQSYTFLDEAPLAGLNYYRLRQVDFDGTESFSEVRLVTVDRSEGVAIRPYPNPAVDELYLDGFAGGPVTVLDQHGRPLRAATLAEGQPLDVRDLPPGFYLLRTDAPSGSQTVKWIKY
ncbi:T9SS type A sorting domain-containing protein [Lewinella sp. W8]|uniref:T9SS type A sorting domain-containing protein n=1 Tax=Lewinella sp. W8 TaxID=2528208 RepID=UPI001067A7F6|nr:T9SS type A sorting domain-containing protein [Lewinella sp. W8]MTB51661.1 T9SS type A sorting domain-containing protein [Lewinella sp. W8]